MNNIQIVNKMKSDLEIEFKNLYSEKEIEDWQNSKDIWRYETFISRYESKLTSYISDNLFEYLEKKYEEHDLNDREKLKVFKNIRESYYWRGLFGKGRSLLPDKIMDSNYVPYCLWHCDFLTIAHILGNVSDFEEVYECLKCDWKYTMESSNYVAHMLREMKNCKNKEAFNKVFDDLCLRDGKYGNSLKEFLETESPELNITNIISIIKGIYIGGDTIKIINKQIKRTTFILELIEQGRLSLEEEDKLFIIKILNEVSKDEEQMTLVNNIIGELDDDQREKMNFYLSNNKQLKKIQKV